MQPSENHPADNGLQRCGANFYNTTINRHLEPVANKTVQRVPLFVCITHQLEPIRQVAFDCCDQ